MRLLNTLTTALIKQPTANLKQAKELENFDSWVASKAMKSPYKLQSNVIPFTSPTNRKNLSKDAAAESTNRYNPTPPKGGFFTPSSYQVKLASPSPEDSKLSTDLQKKHQEQHLLSANQACDTCHKIGHNQSSCNAPSRKP